MEVANKSDLTLCSRAQITGDGRRIDILAKLDDVAEIDCVAAKSLKTVHETSTRV